jgi:hypothetical protein
VAIIAVACRGLDYDRRDYTKNRFGATRTAVYKREVLFEKVEQGKHVYSETHEYYRHEYSDGSVLYYRHGGMNSGDAETLVDVKGNVISQVPDRSTGHDVREEMAQVSARVQSRAILDSITGLPLRLSLRISGALDHPQFKGAVDYAITTAVTIRAAHKSG